MSKNIKFFLIGLFLVCLSVSSLAMPNYIYVVSRNNSNNIGKVTTYSQDSLTGALTKVAFVNAGLNPTQIAFDKTGQFVYVINSGDKNIYQYSVNKITGVLSQVGKSIASGKNPKQIAFVLTPENKQYAYVTNYDDATISAYSVDDKSGNLKNIGTFKTNRYPYALTADPSGTYLYVTTWDTQINRLKNYTINPNNGQLKDITVGLGTYVGYIPFQIKFSPSGKFVYVVNRIDNYNLVSFRFNFIDGSLTQINSVINTTTPIAITFNQDYAYVVLEDIDKISIYNSNGETGKLNLVSGVSSNGRWPNAIAFDPAGKYAYILNYASATIASYSVNTNNNGVLDFINTLSTGNDNPVDLVFNSGSH